jgi:serine/threonine protein kinase
MHETVSCPTIEEKHRVKDHGGSEKGFGHYPDDESDIIGFGPTRVVGRFSDEFKRVRVLGKGSSASVTLRINKNLGFVACKSIPRPIKDSMAIQIKNEIAIHYHLSTRANIAKLLDVKVDDKNIHLIMEVCEGGELFKHTTGGGMYSCPMPEESACALFVEMVSIVNHVHELGVCHRDIKLANFLVSNKGLVLCDFGLATFYVPDIPLTSKLGSPFYMAPEVLLHCYGCEADIWSLGVILYYLLTGTHPFVGDTVDEIFLKIKFAQVEFKSPLLSPDAKDLLRALLHKSPHDRITGVDALQHTWVKKWLGTPARHSVLVEESQTPYKARVNFCIDEFQRCVKDPYAIAMKYTSRETFDSFKKGLINYNRVLKYHGNNNPFFEDKWGTIENQTGDYFMCMKLSLAKTFNVDFIQLCLDLECYELAAWVENVTNIKDRNIV